MGGTRHLNVENQPKNRIFTHHFCVPEALLHLLANFSSEILFISRVLRDLKKQLRASGPLNSSKLALLQPLTARELRAPPTPFWSCLKGRVSSFSLVFNKQPCAPRGSEKKKQSKTTCCTRLHWLPDARDQNGVSRLARKIWSQCQLPFWKGIALAMVSYR